MKLVVLKHWEASGLDILRRRIQERKKEENRRGKERKNQRRKERKNSERKKGREKEEGKEGRNERKKKRKERKKEFRNKEREIQTILFKTYLQVSDGGCVIRRTEQPCPINLQSIPDILFERVKGRKREGEWKKEREKEWRKKERKNQRK
jgi:hydrocephalus-inducing protein